MALIELTVKTSVILALGMLAAVALHRRSAAVRHWILALALFCAAAVPLAALLPSWSIPASLAPAADGTVVDLSLSPATRRGGTPLETQAPAAPSATALNVIGTVALPVWLLGVATNLVLLLIGMLRLSRLGSTRATVNPSMPASVDRISARLGLRRRVTLVRSTRRAVIVTWGVARPRIVLPADVDHWPRQRLDLVLAHELAHISRGDWLVQTAADVCKAVYWFNPLFWAACSRLRYESERACDDVVMNMGVTSHVYATELLAIARSVGRHRQARLPAPAMAARPSTLERRVRAMLNAHLNRGPITRGGRWASAFALAAMTLPIATFAQGTYATFSGVIIDPQDRLLPNATVTVNDTVRNVKHETETNANGRFEFVGLPAGEYTYQAKRPGFRELSGSVSLRGDSVERALKMQVSALQETITVVSGDGAITNSSLSGNPMQKRSTTGCTSPGGVGGTLRPPHKVKDVRPGYPGADGTVELVATIGIDGSVVDVQVAKADRPELAPAAIEAVRQWEFDSTLLNCVPIEVQMNVSVSFGRSK